MKSHGGHKKKKKAKKQIEIVTGHLERISDHCSNIAANSIQSINSSIPKHLLKSKLKEARNDEFSTEIAAFKAHYTVEPVEFVKQ